MARLANFPSFEHEQIGMNATDAIKAEPRHFQKRIRSPPRTRFGGGRPGAWQRPTPCDNESNMINELDDIGLSAR
jgi:hypothetical protein